MVSSKYVGRTLIAIVVTAGIGCADDGSAPLNDGPGDQANDRITITNDAAALGARVTYFDDRPIGVDLREGGGPETQFSLELVAEVLPPSVDGRVLQATSVIMQGNRAIVGYGMAGPDYLGAVDVFNLTNRSRPRLESGALFNDSDVFAASDDGNSLVAAESNGDPTFGFSAAFEVLGLSGNSLILNDNARAGMPSFVTTSVAVGTSRVFATSGNTGGLKAFDRGTWTETDYVELADARWVDISDGKVVVAQGMPGQLSVFDETTMTLLGTYPFPGADVPESKTTVEVVGGKAFIGAGPAGVQIVSVETGALLGSVPRPDPGSLGLDPAVVVTNSVSVDDDLLFISNGEAGVYVAEGEQAFASTGSETLQQVTLLGALQLGPLESVNHIAFKNNYLIVAAGLGGLKIIQIVR